MGANCGPAVARNFTVLISKSNYLVCLDDDGLTTVDSIKKMHRTAVEHDAVMVRGAVESFHKPEEDPKHYRPSLTIQTANCDIEGMTIWKREILSKFLFDPVMYGHEGTELAFRMRHYCSLESFLFEPHSLMYHDFQKPLKSVREKKGRYKKMKKYLASKYPHYKDFFEYKLRLTSNLDHKKYIYKRKEMLDYFKETRQSFKDQVSVITTAHNSSQFLIDFCTSLKIQSDQKFEVIFVDDGSTDDTTEKARELFAKTQIPVTFVETKKIGRGAALNTALEKANNEWCLICDVDDISTYDRVSLLRKVIERYPGKNLFGFNIYDNNSFIRGPIHKTTYLQDVNPRFLFGMPTPFPAIAFSKAKLKGKFNRNLSSGIDYDWLVRHFNDNQIDGLCLPITACYYRTHNQQISHNHRAAQLGISLLKAAHIHKRYIDEAYVDHYVGKFLGFQKIEHLSDFRRLEEYALTLSYGVSRQETVEFSQAVFNLAHELLEGLRRGLILRKNNANAAFMVESRWSKIRRRGVYGSLKKMLQ